MRPLTGGRAGQWHACPCLRAPPVQPSCFAAHDHSTTRHAFHTNNITRSTMHTHTHTRCTSSLFLTFHAPLQLLCLQVSPEEFIKQFVTPSGVFSSPEGALKGGRLVAAAEIAAEPLLRQEVRKQYQARYRCCGPVPLCWVETLRSCCTAPGFLAWRCIDTSAMRPARNIHSERAIPCLLARAPCCCRSWPVSGPSQLPRVRARWTPSTLWPPSSACMKSRWSGSKPAISSCACCKRRRLAW